MVAFLNELIQSLGYVGVYILMGLFAAELIMPVGGFLARSGNLSLPLVILAGTLGSCTGSLLIYYAARLVHPEQVHRLAARHGRWVGISARSTARAERWFDRNAKASVVLSKLVPGVRSAISLVAGYRRMTPGWFLLCTVLPTALSAGILAGAGYVVGNNYRYLQDVLGDASQLVMLGLLVLVIAFFAFRRIRMQRTGQR